MFKDAAHLGSNISLVYQDECCGVYRVSDQTGEGLMTCYPVFPGIMLNYNDFHLEQCISEFQTISGMFCINHCREGRIQWEFKNNQFVYLEAGDLQISDQGRHGDQFSFPLHHYHGLTVGIFPDRAADSLSKIMEGYSVDLPRLIQRFKRCEKPFIIRAGAQIEHIFSELYSVPKEIRASYHKIKVLELFLFLSTLDVPEENRERPYFHRTQVEKVKAIRIFLEEYPHRRYTLEKISAQFQISLTTMKQCFKAVYGMSIYSYMRTYRMNAAAVLLRRGDEGISQIAAAMGYENASKFSAAFKEVIGLTPSEYRKSAV